MPGFHSDTEKQAHVRLILEQRAKLVEEAGLVCMLAHLANLGELTRIFEWQRAQERDAFTECRRREQVEARFSTDREQAQVLRTAPRPHAIRIVRKEGRRAARDKPLVEDDLYLNDARPSLVAYPRLEQTCTICLGLKSHPVVYTCGHSHCFVCIRFPLRHHGSARTVKARILRVARCLTRRRRRPSQGIILRVGITARGHIVVKPPAGIPSCWIEQALRTEDKGRPFGAGIDLERRHAIPVLLNDKGKGVYIWREGGTKIGTPWAWAWARIKGDGGMVRDGAVGTTTKLLFNPRYLNGLPITSEAAEAEVEIEGDWH
ncbi:hypothetical protein B0H19DRAFT_1085512 [Mycena capillaripes]|nr:hypothetical protein B0H19DRAFT_1085512 [Mycena capillaripes]